MSKGGFLAKSPAPNHSCSGRLGFCALSGISQSSAESPSQTLSSPAAAELYRWAAHHKGQRITRVNFCLWQHGLLSAKTARALVSDLEAQGFDVCYGQTGLDSTDRIGNLTSWFGPKYAMSAIPADLDIAIVTRHPDQLVALVEIEETTTKPKVLLGDVLATLLGGHMTFQGRWGFCPMYRHFSRSEFFLLPSKIRTRPSASNANRWAACARQER